MASSAAASAAADSAFGSQALLDDVGEHFVFVLVIHNPPILVRKKEGFETAFRNKRRCTYRGAFLRCAA
jgi:hypothetical protein